MKGRVTSSENRKFVAVVVKSALGVVKKLLTNDGFVKLLWTYVGRFRSCWCFTDVKMRQNNFVQDQSQKQNTVCSVRKSL